MRILSFFFILILLQVLQTIDAHSQTKIFNRVIENSGFGDITQVRQDRQGYIWFGAGIQLNFPGSGGLHRYDGHEIISYNHDPNNNNSLSNNSVECIYIDSANMIWIGTYGSGLDRFDPINNTFTHFHLSNDTVQCILEDGSGNFWIGTKGGLDLFDKKTGKCRHYVSSPNDSSTISSNNVSVIYEDHEKTLWIGCGGRFDDTTSDYGGLNRFNRNTRKFTRYRHNPLDPNSIANNKVHAIFEDSKGFFWVATAGDGLHTLDRTTGNFTHYYYDARHPEKLSRPFFDSSNRDDCITFITEDATGNIWIGTFQQGINKYDPVTKKITHYGGTIKNNKRIRDTISGLFNYWLRDAFFSRDGLMWISSIAHNGNLYNLDMTRTAIPYYQMNNNAGNSFYFEQQTNTLWIGTNQGLIKRSLDTKIEKQWRHDPHDSNSISNDSIGAMRVDTEGKFWMATSKGLNKFDPLANAFSTYWPNEKDRGSRANLLLNLLIDHNEDIWLATFYGAYKMDHRTTQFTRYIYSTNDSNSLSNNIVVCLAQDANNKMWFGTASGVNKLDEATGRFQRYLSGSDFKSIFVDAEGIVWAGARDGLFRYNRTNNTFSRYIDPNSKTEIIDDVLHIMEDNRRNLWVTTSSSIIKINESRDTVRIYGENYGVHPNSFGYADNLSDANGELFFGDQGGYYAFFPDQLKENSTPPEVAFTSFKLGDNEVSPANGGILGAPLWDTKEIKLNYKQNVFSFEFVGIDFKNKQEPKYLYMLQNYDNDWRPVGVDRKAYLFNVPPGEYIFRVRAVNADGLWGEKEISIIITPPWYKTWWAYTMYAICFLSISFFANRTIRNRIIEKERMKSREKELAQAKEIEKAYHQLKETQAQLIQQEKMASLGELTAGIAHEIQNPLNFVNNFSEVSNELIGELKGERSKAKGERNDELQDEILNDIQQNLEKINHHGKRADAIVKGMLQHSRTSSGQKELTDINALCDEYLRLSYHGMRAKDKSFNAEIKTDFDKGIGKINIIPQDIGRVILNMINNAFYAVNERQKAEGLGHKPGVAVSTKKIGDKVFISVADNGNGIPDAIKEKIFQPFFTTKPTGQGTGLGLSLAYDIVKAHGGEIKVETKEGEGSEFIIQLQFV